MMHGSPMTAVFSGLTLCFPIALAHIYYRSKRSRPRTILCWCFCLLPGLLFTMLPVSADGVRFVQLTGILSVFAYLYLFELGVRQSLFLCFLMNTVIYAAALIARYTELFIRSVLSLLSPEAVFIGMFLALLCLCFWIFGKTLRAAISRGLTQIRQQFNAAVVFAAAGYLILPLFFDLWTVQKVTASEYAGMLATLLLLGCGYSLSFAGLAAAQETAEAKKQAKKFSEELRQAEKYYETLTAHQQKVRRIQHDMRHHFRVLESCLHNGQTQRMQDYLEDLLQNIPVCINPVPCANYTAGILLMYYSDQAAVSGIRFQCDAQIPAVLPVSDSHLSVVLGNALQNALEACQRQPASEHPFIELLARVRGNYLALEIRNSFNGFLQYDRDGKLKSGKSEEGHGLGLGSVADIAQRYKGYYSAEPEGGIFVLRVVLGLSAE